MVLFLLSGGRNLKAQAVSRADDQAIEHRDTRELVALVNSAAALVQAKGERAFPEFRFPDSRWRHGDTYVFVMDLKGNMLVHPDPTMEGENEMDLKDVNGKPIVRGLIDAATTVPDKPEGWYHYEWPVPNEILPRWKSSFVRLVTAPSGKKYVVGSGMYDDRMERAFVVDMVKGAVAQIDRKGKAAFPLFRDPKGPFMAKDAYIFVIDPSGVAVVNPGFPYLEGRNLLSWKDTQGKEPIREMVERVRARGSGWIDYMWPKPGESLATQKSAYVSKANLEGHWVVVGCGVYLANAPKTAIPGGKKMTAREVMTLVRKASAVLHKEGDKAYPEFLQKGTKWFHDDTYLFVWKTDGTVVLYAADPGREGLNDANLTDVLGRPFGKMFLEVANSPAGEGWVHYMYPKPGDIFPSWKSTFVKRVTFPSGEQYIVGCGISNMQTDAAFIEDLVNRASALVAQRGPAAFRELRDRTGPFDFMDAYVFVDTPDGNVLVNAGQPSLEGKNVMKLRDVNGTLAAQEYITSAMKNGSAWAEYFWYRPGDNTPVPKRTFVRKVQFGSDTYIVGSGYYSGE